jgi:hypothetical protein
VDKPIGHKYSAYATPMHITQLSLVMLKATFAELGEEGFVFRFTQDFNTTGVVIDTTYNKESEIYGKKPAIIVNRGGVSSQQISTSDLAGQNINTSAALKTSLVTASLIIKILSKMQSEVDYLSNEVFNFLLMCRSVFPSLMGLHRVEHPTLSEISVTEQDDTMYYCVASLPYSMQYKWTHLVPQNILNSIGFYVNDQFIFDIPEQNNA